MLCACALSTVEIQIKVNLSNSNVVKFGMKPNIDLRKRSSSMISIYMLIFQYCFFIIFLFWDCFNSGSDHPLKLRELTGERESSHPSLTCRDVGFDIR